MTRSSDATSIRYCRVPGQQRRPALKHLRRTSGSVSALDPDASQQIVLDFQPVRKPAGVFIDLFAGCGGLSLGLMASGWRGLFAVEKDTHAFASLRANLIDGHRPEYRFQWPDWLPTEPHEIAAFNTKYWKRLRELRGSVDLIAGGPPCQGFSFSGLRDKNDSRNQLLGRYLKIIEVVRPKYLLIENVHGIAVAFGKTKRKRGGVRGRKPTPYAEKVKRYLEKNLGYRVFPRLVRAADCGVPQLRPRYIMIGIQEDLVRGMPNFDPYDLFPGVRLQFLEQKGLPTESLVSVSEAISDLQVKGKALVECEDSPGFRQIVYRGPESAYQRLMHAGMDETASPNSLRLANHREGTIERFQRMLVECRRGVSLSDAEREKLGLRKHTLVVLDPSRPSHTLTTLPDDLLHYGEPRILTVRECARIQSFPDWFEFRGKYTTGGKLRTKESPRYSQVGNAVPPFLGECLGRLIARVNLAVNSRQVFPVSSVAA